MKQLLVDLEKKLVALVEAYTKSSAQCADLVRENTKLHEANKALEDSLLQEAGSRDSLVKEKEAIKGAIQELLQNIDTTLDSIKN